MLYIFLADIFTVMFRLTGMTEEKARFQVISLLTNSGFTTSESEFIVKSKRRRSIAKIIMIFGYTFTATIVSGVISIVVTYNLNSDSFSLLEIFILLLIFFIFYFVRKFFIVKFIFNKFSEKVYRYFFSKEKKNSIMVLEEIGENVIAQVFLNFVPSDLENKTLAEIDITNKYDILILTITNSENKILHVKASTILENGSIVTVMGKKKSILEVLC